MRRRRSNRGTIDGLLRALNSPNVTTAFAASAALKEIAKAKVQGAFRVFDNMAAFKANAIAHNWSARYVQLLGQTGVLENAEFIKRFGQESNPVGWTRTLYPHVSAPSKYRQSLAGSQRSRRIC